MIERIQDEEENAAKMKLAISKYNDQWSIFEQVVDEHTSKYQTTVKRSYKMKEQHIRYCKKQLREAELDAEKKSIELIQKFTSFRKHKMNTLEGLPDKAL